MKYTGIITVTGFSILLYFAVIEGSLIFMLMAFFLLWCGAKDISVITAKENDTAKEIAEIEAIGKAVCIGMESGDFYKDPKGTIANARLPFKVR